MHYIERLDWSGNICQIHYIYILITIITRKYETQTLWTAAWSNEIETKYNERYELRVKASKKSKKHDFFQKSNHIYDFFGRKVIIMTKN